MKKLAIVLLLLMSLLLLGCDEEQEATDPEAATDEVASGCPVGEEMPEAADTADFFSGEMKEYQVLGANIDGSSYSGDAVIIESEVEGIYQLTVLSGENSYLGFGMAYGDDLMVIGAEGPVLEVFRKTKDGYNGIWYSGDELGAEVLSAEAGEASLPATEDVLTVQPWPRPIDFEVRGTNPDGTEYTAVLQTHPLGAGAAARWTFDEDGSEVSGGALMIDDDTFFVVFELGVGIYELMEEDIWRGEWFSPGNESLGEEWITPLN
ncbi:hypothetical protein K8R78_01885 [bacterium]|nr:hypothetical protein [bacterium]